MQIFPEEIKYAHEALLPIEKKYIEANATITPEGRFVVAFSIRDNNPLADDAMIFSSPDQVAEFGMFLTKMAEDLSRRTQALKELGQPATFFLQQQFIPERSGYDPAKAGDESTALNEKSDQ